jgi:hypothetical protein
MTYKSGTAGDSHSEEVMKLLATIITALLGAGQAFGQAVVTPNAVNYGPGKIDGSFTYRYIGQNVTACGRAAQHDPHQQFFTIGVSPYETVVAFPPEINPQAIMSYSFKMVCVSGPVTVGQLYMGLNRPTIEVNSPSQIEVLGDTGPYQPSPSPNAQCGPRRNPDGTISGRACYNRVN